MNSKQKGGRGEREFASLCREEGYNNAHRGQQFSGGIESPDVKGLPGIHEAMQQSIKDSDDKAIPIVAHRRNRDGWLITMRATDWFGLYREWEARKHIE